MGKKKKVDPSSPFASLADLKKKLEEAEKAEPSPAQKKKSPPAPTSRDTSKPSEEEDALTFHRMMSGVVPLDEKSGRVPRTAATVKAEERAEAASRRSAMKTAAEAEAQAVHEHLRTLVEGGSRFEIADDGRRVEGRRVDVPPDALRRLRRGLLPIDARIDLHGLRAEAARASLEAFLREKRARGERCLLVVHGKGEHTPGGFGVLRGEIAAWLSQGRASEHVAAFATAQDGDGGEGAVYVLLRR